MFLVLVSALCMAQRDSSLTKDFERLSAKQRARIAAEEEQAAALDTAYQARMASAEGRFQEGAFEDALGLYRQARTMRPYNVHPKVKIQDLEALVARQKAAPSPPAVKEDPPASVPVAVEAQPKVVPPVVDQAPVPPAVTSAPSASPMTGPKVVRVSVPVTTVPEPAEPSPADGVHERMFKEGRAVVLERQVVEDGRPTLWRMVTHPWGEVVYFKDGEPVPARVWSEQFPPQ